jgi:hypothetical protein
MTATIRLLILPLALLALQPAHVQANAPTVDTTTPASAKQLVGWVEFVQLQPSGKWLKAKLDTGALTSSIHATKIRYFERDGKTWVRFLIKRPRMAAVDGMPAVPSIKETIEAPLNRRVRIKQHAVDFVERPEVNMTFKLGGQVHTAAFTLTDRSNFKYPVLLGRRFLSTSVFVDSARMNLTGMPQELLNPPSKK